jgi:DNA-binding MarR family transcriptional regulator
MTQTTAPSQEMLRQTVDLFWESFPPFWQKVRAHIRDVAVDQFGISVEQFHILRHIRRGQGSVSELADAKNISRAAISQAVDILFHRGLIIRTTNETDRRHIQLDLTPEGSTLLDAIFNNTRQWMMNILSPLTVAELKSLTGSMESLKKIH